MDYGNELTSSLSFASSSYVSNGTSCPNLPAEGSTEIDKSIETLQLGKLSECLKKLLTDSDYDYTDAEIVVEDITVGVHKCILAARSQYFHELFKKGNTNGSGTEGKPRYMMSELVTHGRVGLEAFQVFLNYMYTGKVLPSPSEVSTCVDKDCGHDACGPAINYALELLCASATFQTKELVMPVQRHLFEFVDKALEEDVVPILLAAFHYELEDLKSHCIERIASSGLDDLSLERELPYEVSNEIIQLRRKSQLEAEQIEAEVDPGNEEKNQRIRKIHKALDSDDVELVKLLLAESNITLDEAYGLHYAVAYCDPKVVKDVLGLELTDLNRPNRRGYTVIHVAARRKEPAVLLALLSKGVSALIATPDGRTAVSICRKLTRPKDFNEIMKRGEITNKDQLCINILEREMKRNAVSGDVLISAEVTIDDLYLKLDYYENRVAFARLLFPAEAGVAMDFADVDSTSADPLPLPSRGSAGNFREVDLNETPSVRTKRLHARLRALDKTVETGRRYFPHCSEVLDRFLEDDMPDAFFLEKGSPAEQQLKKNRFMELKDEVQKAFDKDIAETKRSALTSSSCSSSSPKNGMRKVRRK